MQINHVKLIWPSMQSRTVVLTDDDDDDNYNDNDNEDDGDELSATLRSLMGRSSSSSSSSSSSRSCSRSCSRSSSSCTSSSSTGGSSVDDDTRYIVSRSFCLLVSLATLATVTVPVGTLAIAKCFSFVDLTYDVYAYMQYRRLLCTAAAFALLNKILT
uniref:Uncharacterized protein n=1 Tax=Glossina austeni TaxID=7395 RepID=A0A1A9UM33_GLOAU